MWKWFTPLLWAGLCQATPDRQIHAHDRLLGSNETHYAILRTQYDNEGSHYVSASKHTLIEYAKAPLDPKYESSTGEQVSQKVLLEDKAIDPSVASPDAPLRSVGSRDDSVTLAAILEKYPMVAKPWSAERIAKLNQQTKGGVYLGELNLLWGGYVKQRFGVDRNAEFDWQLEGVSEDATSLYLHVRSGGEDYFEQRIISLSPRTSRQVRDHLARQPMYIVAGRFEKLEDAITRAHEVKKTTGHVLGYEVWSMRLPTDKWVYVVCDANSTNHLDHPGFAQIESASGLKLEVVPGEKLWERFDVGQADGP